MTYDPLGVSRSELTGGATDVTPEEHADVLGVRPTDGIASAPHWVHLFDFVDKYLKEDESQ